MILLELALQGVRGFPGTLRIPFKAGVNVACDVPEERRRALLDALYHCIYPDGVRAGATEHLRDPDADESRIALTFHGRDKITYRLIREVVTGAMRLYKFDGEAKKYRLFTDVANEVAQYVRVQQQLPDEVTYERLFMYAAAAMPSKGAKAETRSGVGLLRDVPAPSAPGLPHARFMSGTMARPGSLAGAMPSALDAGGALNPTNALVQSEMAKASAEAARDDFPETVEAQKELLVRMRADLDAVVRGNRAQQEIDQLAARKFEINERAGEVADLLESHAQLIAERDSDHALDNMPPNLADRLRDFESREERFRADEVKIRDELIRMEREADEDLVLPLVQDRYFLASVVLAVVFVVLAVALSRPFIAVLNVPAAMVALAAALRYLGDLERTARRLDRFKGIEDRLDRLHKQRDLDTGVTRRLMEKLEVDLPSELLEQVEKHEARAKEIERLSAAIQASQTDPQARAEVEELAQIEARVQRLEVEVVSATGALEGEETLRRKVEALEAQLGPDVPPRLKSPPLGLADARSAPPRAGSAVDLSADLVAPSEFSSHVSPMSPLSTGEFRSPNSTGEFPSPGWTAELPHPPSTDDLRVPDQTTELGLGGRRQSSGEFPAPRGSSGLGITSDLPSAPRPAAGSGASLPAFPGPSAPSSPAEPAASEPPPSGLPPFRATPAAARTPSIPGTPISPPPPGRAASIPGAPVPRPRAGSIAGTPVAPPPGRPASIQGQPISPLPRPSSVPGRPLVPPPSGSGGVLPSAPGRPAAGSGPVVPASPASPPGGSPFDFGGGFIGAGDEEDEEDAAKPRGSDSEDDGGAKTEGYLAMSSGFGGFGGGGGLGGYGGGEGVVEPDRSRELVQATVDLLSLEVDALAEKLGPRLTQYLEAFTEGRFTGAEVGPRGEVTLLPKEGEPLPFRELEGDDLDPTDAALRFTLAEFVLRKYRIPVLVDAPFCELDGKRHKLLDQMLGYFARAAQVIVFAEGVEFAGHRISLDG